MLSIRNLVPLRQVGLGLTAAMLLAHCSIDDADRTFGDVESEAGEANERGGAAPSSSGGRGGAPGSSGGAGEGGASSGGVSGRAEGGSTDGGQGASDGNQGGDPSTGGAPEPTATGGRTDGSGGSNGSECSTRCNALGEACESPNDCESGLCTDGVCCESRCDGICQACSAELTGAADGKCTDVLRDTDPDDDCEEEAPESCGNTGLCDGRGECAVQPEDTTCGAGSCSADVALTAKTCDGEGTCRDGAEVECAPYACGTGACRSGCSSNAHCAGDFVCIGSSCQEPSALLGPCDETADCARGECDGGRCVLYLDTIGIKGAAVSGGGNPQLTHGWWSSDQNGQNRVEASEPLVSIGRLYSSLDIRSHFDPPLAPDTYLLLTGAESSNPLTRTFQFDFSDGTGVTKQVEASGSDDIILYFDPVVGSGDDFVLFHFTGADVQVLRKSY